MKKVLSVAIMIVISMLSMAQAPTMINYQGVARNSSGAALTSQSITMRLTIHDLTAGGAIVYQETRNVTTSSLGLFNIAIGSAGATSVTGTIGGVNWASGAKFLQVEMDPTGHTSFLDMGTSQLLSVPYALNAAGAPPIGTAGGDLAGSYPNPTVAKLRGVNVSTTSPVTNDILSYNGTNWTPTSLSGIGGVSGSGTLNYIPKWTPNGTTLGVSRLFDNGTSVGLGTATPSPAINFDIQGNVAQLRLVDLNNTSEVWLSAPGSGYTGGVGTNSNHDFPLFTAGLDRLTVKAGGNVGIGITTPIAKLHTTATDTPGIRSDVNFSAFTSIGSFRSGNVFSTTGANFGLFSKTGASINGNHPPQGGAGVFGFDSSEMVLSNGVTGYSVGNYTGRAGVYGFGSQNASPTTTWYWSGFSGGTFVGGDNGVNGLVTADAPLADVNGDQSQKVAVNAYTSYPNALGTNYGIYVLGAYGGSNNYAGYFNGNVQINGNLSATGSKAFRIDHPLDPANKYLSHFAVESPEVENIYNGNVVTDATGRATVQLPDYFSSINKDFKYQLTIVDETQFALVRISKKINGNKFEIRTDKPNIEVSWQVTAVRNDKAALEFVTPAVTEKKGNEKGKYLNPELYNQPQEKGVHYNKNAKILQQKQLESNIPVKINTPVTEQKQMPAVATEEMAAKEKGQN